VAFRISLRLFFHTPAVLYTRILIPKEFIGIRYAQATTKIMTVVMAALGSHMDFGPVVKPFGSTLKKATKK